MAVLATVKPTINGVLLAAVAAAAGGDQIVKPNGNVILYVKNGGASAINVTVDAAALQGGLSFVDPVIAVAAGAERLIGPLDPRFFNDATGLVSITYSAVTTVTVAAVQVG